MKNIIYLFILNAIFYSYSFSQLETNNWVFGKNVLLNFSTNPPNASFNVLCDEGESPASFSDENGNLLFYTHQSSWSDLKIRDENNIQMLNGDFLELPQEYSISTTQGKLFLKKPGSNNNYYLFILANDNTEKSLIYSEIDNSGNGAVISKYNKLHKEMICEKLTATKHCNNKAYWLITAYYANKPDPFWDLSFKGTVFLAYLIDENGVNESPIRSEFDFILPRLGQIKFNNASNLLATATNSALYLFNFDNASGQVSLNNKIELDIQNGYGLEFAPNDSLVYINEYQYNIYTNSLVKLINNYSLLGWQRGLDDKLYSFYSSPTNSFLDLNNYSNLPNIGDYFDNGWLLTGPVPAFKMARIEKPNLTGVTCNLDTSFINIPITNYPNMGIGMPNYPSFLFNHSPSEFTYTGNCTNDVFHFSLENNVIYDSIEWSCFETNQSNFNAIGVLNFPSSGEYSVTCTIYQNGNITSSTQCVYVCGENSVNIPNEIDLCSVEYAEVNALNVCSTTYEWNNGDTTSRFITSTPGTYILKTTNSCGVFYDTLLVTSENCTAQFDIPNIITTNDDNTNDLFSINVKNTKSFQYEILNRWGEVIFEGNTSIQPINYYNNSTIVLWDGYTTNNIKVNEGTYFYHIIAESINDSKKEFNGFLQVVK